MDIQLSLNALNTDILIKTTKGNYVKSFGSWMYELNASSRDWKIKHKDPELLKNITYISTGANQSLALINDGKLYGWGQKCLLNLECTYAITNPP